MEYANPYAFTNNVTRYDQDRSQYQWLPHMKLNRGMGVPWIEALRGGEYTQTFGQLYDTGNARCAIGVLCEVLDTRGEHDMTRYPTAVVTELLGAELVTLVVDLNDIGHWRFTEIADYLEMLLEDDPEPITEQDVQTFVLGPLLPSPSLEPVPA